MWIQLTNSKCKVIRATEEDKAWLRDFLQFDDGKAKYRKGAKVAISLYSDTTDSFPSGLLSLVIDEAKKLKTPFKVEVGDARIKPCEPDLTVDLSNLRDYQLEAVRIAQKRTRGILWLPTGAGKTQIAIGLVQSTPCKWLFAVDQADLVHQTAARYAKITGKQAGIIGDGEWKPGEELTCATFQTLYRRLTDPKCQEFLASIDGVIVDEAHTLPAVTFWHVLQRLSKAYYRIGLSATPLSRSDKRSVLTVAGLGGVIYRVTPQFLIERGYLSLPVIKMMEVKQRVDPDSATSYPALRRKYVLDSKVRNAAILEAVQSVEKPALVFIQEIRHGKVLTKMLRAQGYNVELVYGEDEVNRRQTLIESLERGDLDIIVCSSVFTKGVDIPQLRGGVNAAGGKSIISTLQKLGRGMRVVDGKSVFDWYDFYDSGHKWLGEHSEERLRTYESEGYTVHRMQSLAAAAMAAQVATEKVTKRKKPDLLTADFGGYDADLDSA